MDATWAMDDIPHAVTDRPIFTELSPDEEQEFLRKQADYEAAYRNGEPLALFHALAHAWWSRQTVPGWLVPAIGNALMRTRTDKEAERERELMRQVRRYACVESLRRERHPTDARRKLPKDAALDLAVKLLRGEPAGGATRGRIEESYDEVRKSLEREGRESRFFYLVQQSRADREFRPDAVERKRKPAKGGDRKAREYPPIRWAYHYRGNH